MHLVDLGLLPFHVGMADRPTNGAALPDRMPFALSIRNGLLVERPNPEVDALLAQAYGRGSVVGTPMSEGGLGRRYADDFFAFILRKTGGVKGARLLELGCGSGYLLWRLNEQGADAVGLEPGSQAEEAAQEHGLRILRGTFPHPGLAEQGRFDLILHYAVLEHALDPLAFLKAQRPLLAEGGRIVFAVPDCGPFIAQGDPSMFLHEHWSYFSRESLRSLAAAAGFELLALEPSGFGGALYALAAPGATVSADQPPDLLAFPERLARSVSAARAYFRDAAVSRKQVGVFCAARVINLLELAAPPMLPRLFDDDPRLAGRYYPPFDRAVESRAALLERPVDELIILSRAFGERIRAELAAEASLRSTRFLLPEEWLGYSKADTLAGAR